MNSNALINTDFPSLGSTNTVGDATREMLQSRVTDLPVVDATGRLLGMLKLEHILAVLLPRAALIGDGIPDLAFVANSMEQCRGRMRDIENKSIEGFISKPEHVAHPDTSPIEIVLLLYKGANNIPVVSRDDGKLIGMVAARDVLMALQGERAR